jgi:hypothetical protein
MGIKVSEFQGFKVSKLERSKDRAADAPSASTKVLRFAQDDKMWLNVEALLKF